MWKFLFVLVILSPYKTRAELSEPHPDIQRSPADGNVEFDPDNNVQEKQFSCSTDDDLAIFQWFKVESVDEKTELVEITNQVSDEITVDGGTLVVGQKALKVGDVYRCKLDDEKFADFELVDIKESKSSKNFRVEKFPRSFTVVEAEDLKITCTLLNRSAEGFDANDVAIRWYMWKTPDDLKFEDPKLAGNCTTESMVGTGWEEITQDLGGEDREEPHIKLLSKEGLEKAILKIEDAVRSDRRGFKCVAYNTTGDIFDCSESVTYVRVKDKLAALWPFLGIVAEVIVLSVCILIFEKRRANKEALDEEEDDDGINTSASNPNGEKNTVRHRK